MGTITVRAVVLVPKRGLEFLKLEAPDICYHMSEVLLVELVPYRLGGELPVAL